MSAFAHESRIIVTCHIEEERVSIDANQFDRCRDGSANGCRRHMADVYVSTDCPLLGSQEVAQPEYASVLDKSNEHRGCKHRRHVGKARPVRGDAGNGVAVLYEQSLAVSQASFQNRASLPH